MRALASVLATVFALVSPQSGFATLSGAFRLGRTKAQSRPSTPNTKSPGELFRRGQDALATGDLSAAEEAFRAVLALDPRSAAAYANLGVVEMRRRNWDKAIANLNTAEMLDPHMAGIRLNIGLVEYRRANYAAAIAPLTSVLRDEPESTQARYLLGFCYSFLEKYADAVKTLEPLWPQMSNNFMYLYVLGVSAFHSGDAALDQKATGRLLEIGEDKPEFHLLMGKAFLNRNEDQKALDEFQRAEAARPDLPFLHFNLGMAYHRLGKDDLAESEFRKDIALEPDMAYNYEQLGILYLKQSREGDAEKNFREALRREPRMPTSLLELARLCQHRGDNLQALKLLDSAVKLAPDNQNVHFARGQVLLRLGRTEEGKQELVVAQRLINSSLNRDRAKMQDVPVPNPELAQQP